MLRALRTSLVNYLMSFQQTGAFICPKKIKAISLNTIQKYLDYVFM